MWCHCGYVIWFPHCSLLVSFDWHYLLVLTDINCKFWLTLFVSFDWPYFLLLTDIATTLCVIFLASRDEVKEKPNQCFVSATVVFLMSYYPFKLYMPEPIKCYCVYHNHPQSMNGKGNKFIKANTLIHPATAIQWLPNLYLHQADLVNC